MKQWSQSVLVAWCLLLLLLFGLLSSSSSSSSVVSGREAKTSSRALSTIVGYLVAYKIILL